MSEQPDIRQRFEEAVDASVGGDKLAASIILSALSPLIDAAARDAEDAADLRKLAKQHVDLWEAIRPLTTSQAITLIEHTPSVVPSNCVQAAHAAVWNAHETIKQAARDAEIVSKLQWLMDHENHFTVSKHNHGVTIYSACMGTDGKQIGNGRTFAQAAATVQNAEIARCPCGVTATRDDADREHGWMVTDDGVLLCPKCTLAALAASKEGK